MTVEIICPTCQGYADNCPECQDSGTAAPSYDALAAKVKEQGEVAQNQLALICRQSDRIEALEAERDAAHTQCGHNQLTINAMGERCSALEALLAPQSDAAGSGGTES